MVVVLGTNNALELGPNSLETYITKKIIHPEYNEAMFENNIALLRIETTPKSFPRVNEINSLCLCIPSIEKPSKRMSISGWPQKPDKLHTLDVFLLDDDECKVYGRYFKEDKMYCVGDQRGRRDPSEEDIGSPLVLTEGDQSYLLGIVSFSIKNERTVYLKTAPYLSWIKQQVDSNCEEA
ncbi:tryptase-like protein [Dinothrombium tinctorium]|uniref:Tryptase-like protein n=1 Tax=Dinothrombium tinctorium TaxID=1965070 RepID=A0A443RFM1_9ACAR|nr:tryptase-like protein [Dinothrombium tinctorium]